MTYSMYLYLTAATLGCQELAADTPPQKTLADALGPILQRIRHLLQDFGSQPISPQGAFDFEHRLQAELRELGRVGVEWTVNQLESKPGRELPLHVEFDGLSYTRVRRQTPQEVSTTFGKIRLWRTGYRPTSKTGDATIFPLHQHLGIVAGATPALAERAARYQAEAGATQRRTLQRLADEHGVAWGVKKLRQVTGLVACAMSEHRHDAQVKQLLHWLDQAWQGKGRHKPVLSVGRDGISIGVPVRGGTIYEVASAGTVTVLGRKGKRIGTVYLAFMPESKQGTMSERMTQLLQDVLQGWQRPMPRLCYVTDAGDNETTYYQKVLRPMRHPRTREKLDWIRVVDYYHASERIWSLAETLFGTGGTGPVARGWARRMLKLLKKPSGIRRVLNSAAALRSRYPLKGSKAEQFEKAYRYLQQRTKYMRYDTYKQVGIPCGSGVTEAACKTIYTQRLKLSGMRWKRAGAQTILNLRVLLLSSVWDDTYRRMLNNFETVQVPTCELSTQEKHKKPA